MKYLIASAMLSLVSALFLICRAAELPAANHLMQEMAQATVKLNYQGVALYQRGSEIQSLRIVHRGAPFGEAERIVSLDGPPREIVRDAGKVTCVSVDDQSVMVEKAQPRNPLNFGVNLDNEQLSDHYAMRTIRVERIAGRDTYVVAIIPNETSRYGYQLWIDQENSMLLKSAVVDAQGRTLEQTRFAQVSFPDEIGDFDLEPQFTHQDFNWVSLGRSDEGRSDEAAVSTQKEVIVDVSPSNRARLDWSLSWLPAGFAMKNESMDALLSRAMDVSHRVYTDGLAMFSVFVEPWSGDRPLPDGTALGYSTLGAINTFSTIEAGHKVTVVGELPRSTVSRIASSIRTRLNNASNQ